MNTVRTYSPPPIGEALSVGWNTYKANFGPIFIGTLCAMVCGFVPVVGHFIADAGYMNVGLKAIRGQTIDPKDGFIGFDKFIDHLVMGLLKISGALLCVCHIITIPLFQNGTFFIIDQNMDWRQAMDRCMEQVKPQLGGWLIFYFAVVLAVSGVVLIPTMFIVFVCFITIILFFIAIPVILLASLAVVFLMPIAYCALAYAYDNALRQDEKEVVVNAVPAV